jgi:hypothetical protein
MKEVDFNLIFKRIQNAAKAYQDNDLAAFLGISPQAVFGAKKKKQIPKTWFSTIQEKTEVTREELYRGTVGAMAQVDTSYDIMDEEQLDDRSISELLNDTQAVLESDTVYRQALASNIRAFKQAVVNEDKMKNTDEKIDQMMKQIETLTEIVLQGQAITEPEKKRAGNDD